MSENKKGALGLPADSPLERFLNGIVVENPTTVLVLGMCPTLAVTTSAINGLSMGLATTFVLALSNLVISLLRKVIPDTVRIPSFIVVIASFVTLVDLLMQAYLPALNEALGVYIPLIVVNCIIFGRAESYASKHGAVPAFFDGLGMGLGFTCSITIIGLVRELIGAGTAFGISLLGEDTIIQGPVGRFFGMYTPISIFILQAGAFFVLGALMATMNRIKRKREEKGKDVSKFGSGGCMNVDMEIPSGKDKKEDKTKTEDKTENKTKTEDKTESKTENKTESKTENKTESKTESKTENKVEDNTEDKAKNITKDQKEDQKEDKKEDKKEDEKEENDK